MTADDTEVPLRVVEGATANKAMCTRLAVDLADRGLDVSGAVRRRRRQGLERAIRSVFGAKALIQRCRQQGAKGPGHLPELERPLVQRRLGQRQP